MKMGKKRDISQRLWAIDQAQITDLLYTKRMNNYHLSEQALQGLRNEHRRMKRVNGSSKKADCLKAVYLLGSGWKVCDVCEALLLDENTVYRYFSVYESEGLKGLLKSRHKGSEVKLTKRELVLLEGFLSEHYCRTTKQIIAYVKSEFEVDYSVPGMNSLLKRLDYVYKKPQPVPGKSDPQQQADFIKEYWGIRKNMSSEDSLFFMDGVHPHHNPTIQKGWFKRGGRVAVKTGTRFGRLNINGAIDIDTLEMVSSMPKQLTESSTLDFLFSLREKRDKGWIYLVLDNAGYYNTKTIREVAEKLAIKLVYLPPYSPNLNLIERVWLFMKKNLLYNRYFATFDEFKASCKKFLNNLHQHDAQLRTLMTENFQTFE